MGRLTLAATAVASLLPFSSAYFAPYSQPGSHAFTLQTFASDCIKTSHGTLSSDYDRLLLQSLGVKHASDCLVDPIHHFHAAGHSLNLLGHTKTSCPPFVRSTGQCPTPDNSRFSLVSFNTTIPLPTTDLLETGPGPVHMDATVPFGQQLYVRRDGLLQYTRALAPLPPKDAYTDLFTLRSSFADGTPGVQLLFNHTSFYACPKDISTSVGNAAGDRYAHSDLHRRSSSPDSSSRRHGDTEVADIYAKTPSSTLERCRPVQAIARSVRGSGEVFEYN